MKIKFEIDDEAVYEILDGILVTMLKRQLATDRELIEEDAFVHEDDKALTLKNIAAYEHLIAYYSAPGDDDA